MGIVGMRCLMIIGMIAGFAGFFAGVASSDAVNVAKSAGDKNKAAGGAAGCFTVAGACILIATSWSAHKIIKKYQMIMGGSLNSAVSRSERVFGKIVIYYFLIGNTMDHWSWNLYRLGCGCPFHRRCNHYVFGMLLST